MLRIAVPHWLAEPEFAALVVSYLQAPAASAARVRSMCDCGGCANREAISEQTEMA